MLWIKKIKIFVPGYIVCAFFLENIHCSGIARENDFCYFSNCRVHMQYMAVVQIFAWNRNFFCYPFSLYRDVCTPICIANSADACFEKRTFAWSGNQRVSVSTNNRAFIRHKSIKQYAYPIQEWRLNCGTPTDSCKEVERDEAGGPSSTARLAVFMFNFTTSPSRLSSLSPQLLWLHSPPPSLSLGRSRKVFRGFCSILCRPRFSTALKWLLWRLLLAGKSADDSWEGTAGALWVSEFDGQRRAHLLLATSWVGRTSLTCMTGTTGVELDAASPLRSIGQSNITFAVPQAALQPSITSNNNVAKQKLSCSGDRFSTI